MNNRLKEKEGKNILKKTVLTFIILIALVPFLFIISPKPTARLIHKLFEGGMAVKPENYRDIEKMTISHMDLSYQSMFEDGYLDIITPKTYSDKLPVIIWVHGGAFLGGDKSDVTEYAVQIASKGYIVVNMNYELAPGAVYPSPLKQVDEVYAYIKAHSEKYHIDLEQVYFAGDSAGAQIVSQYVNIQVDDSYSKMVGTDATIPPETIKGTLLFCGPYDIAQFTNISDNFLIRFLLNRIGWAYIGERDWMNSALTKEASIIEHISENYPRTFITDGNIHSFEEQGLALTQKLRDFNIIVDDVFYSKNEAELGHEYQFVMNTSQAENTFNKMIEFLEKTRD